MTYDLSHELLLDIRNFISDGAHRDRKVSPQKQLYITFFNTCRSPQQRAMAPYPERLDLQAGNQNFRPFQCLRQLALIELTDMKYQDLPKNHGALLQKIAQRRGGDSSQCRLLSEMLDMAVQRLVTYCEDTSNAYTNARFLDLNETVGEGGNEKVIKLQDAVASKTRLTQMVLNLQEAFDTQGIDMTAFKPNQFAVLAVYYAKFLTHSTSRTRNWINGRYCNGLRQYVPGNEIEPEAARHEHLASQCTPRHYDGGGVLQPAVLEQAGQAIAAAPVTCELCHVGFSGFDKFEQHCRQVHNGVAEYRKRTFYKAREAGMQPLLPWGKRSMVQSFQFFRMFSVPGSRNEWTTKAHERAEPRREEACVICAVKDWLENRHEVYLFKEATNTTTWSKHFYYAEEAGGGVSPPASHHRLVEDSGVFEDGSDVSPPAWHHLLVEDSGVFCLGPKDHIQKLLNVERYIERWPLIPRAELHASSVQHPDDTSMRWLLNTQRVKRHLHACDKAGGVAQPAGSVPPSAGIGEKKATAYMCKCCVDHLCISKPKMPPLALANDFFLGRHHPVFREATLATRMLASSARLLMRQLFLGRGASDEAHKGMTGNTMLIAQPTPSYDQVLPNMNTLTDGMVVLFCKSSDDV